MFRYESTSLAAPTTSTRWSTAIGGIAAPLPSKITTSGLRSAASRAPSATFETNTAPASPPPARRQPIVGTPASAAISRWSDAACRPARESAISSSSGRRRLDDLGLRRPAAAHRDDDDVAVAREQAREVRGDSRLPDALARADHGDRRQLERLEHRRVEPEVGADVRQARPRARARPSGTARRARAPARRRGRRPPPRQRSRRPAARRSRPRGAASRVPPTRIAPTHSYGSARSASRTTGA